MHSVPAGPHDSNAPQNEVWLAFLPDEKIACQLVLARLCSWKTSELSQHKKVTALHQNKFFWCGHLHWSTPESRKVSSLCGTVYIVPTLFGQTFYIIIINHTHIDVQCTSWIPDKSRHFLSSADSPLLYLLPSRTVDYQKHLQWSRHNDNVDTAIGK